MRQPLTRNECCAEIRRMLAESGLDTRDFADLCYVSVNTLNRWRTGRRAPQPYTVRLIRYKLINQGYIRR